VYEARLAEVAVLREDREAPAIRSVPKRTRHTMSYILTLTLPADAELSVPVRRIRIADLAEVSLPDADVARLPDLRAEIAAARGEILTENGSTAPQSAASLAGDAWSVLLPSVTAGTLAGARNAAEPCACGLPLAAVGLDEPAVNSRARVRPVAQSTNGFVLLAADLAAALEDAGLAVGARFLTPKRSTGVRIVLPERRLLAGSPEEAGCPTCGREEALIGGVRSAVPARYSWQFQGVAPAGDGWAWHPLMSQRGPLIGPKVRSALIASAARFDSIPLRTGASGWLAKEYR